MLHRLRALPRHRGLRALSWGLAGHLVALTAAGQHGECVAHRHFCQSLALYVLRLQVADVGFAVVRALFGVGWVDR